jgi:uncharacterized protein
MQEMDLLEAAAEGRLARVEELLKAGCNPNVTHPKYGSSALSRACFSDRVEVVRHLLMHGADPNLRLTYASPVDGRIERNVVALMSARSLEVVTALLESGADPNISDDEGTTPLMRAVLAAPPQAASALLAAGAVAQARNSRGDSAADLVRKRMDWLRGTRASETAKGRKRIAALEQMLAILAAT